MHEWHAQVFTRIYNIYESFFVYELILNCGMHVHVHIPGEGAQRHARILIKKKTEIYRQSFISVGVNLVPQLQ